MDGIEHYVCESINSNKQVMQGISLYQKVLKIIKIDLKWGEA